MRHAARFVLIQAAVRNAEPKCAIRCSDRRIDISRRNRGKTRKLSPAKYENAIVRYRYCRLLAIFSKAANLARREPFRSTVPVPLAIRPFRNSAFQASNPYPAVFLLENRVQLAPTMRKAEYSRIGGEDALMQALQSGNSA